MSSNVLVADDVKAALLEALAPLIRECDEAAAIWPVVGPENVRLVVQLHPLVVQVVAAAAEDRPARRIVAFAGSRLPDGGRALGEAAEAVTAGILSAIGENAAERVAQLAAVPAAGLCVACDPSTEGVALVLAAPDVGLENAVMLGGIGEHVTTH